ncbi:Beta-lactamase [Desulfonema limicola]|uniref:Beta-lactamase n=1 Tax=Desulfonema limicola TaxID=45656 RepID=A0A975B4D2_9BACT|nr:serine hydrolase [Desulfonema limicola]QTA78575.1 Beta-lactamase [Desulfonema limicola]
MIHVHNLMEKAVYDNIFPGGVLLAAEKGEILFCKAYGHADIFANTKMNVDTVFDLASLTKPLAASAALMKLTEETSGLPEWELGNIIPEICSTDKAHIKIKHLLSHTSGFPDYRPYYLKINKVTDENPKTVLRELLIKESLVSFPGKKVIYSDLGFMMLEWVIEKLTATALDCFLDKEIYSPLGIKNLFFPGISYKKEKHFAATELCPWRRKLLKGAVHDDNAYAAGGIQGHAGLFGTIKDVFILLCELLNAVKGNKNQGVFKKKVVEYFFRPYRNTGRSLGFDMPSPEGSSSGCFFCKNSVGHLGFTGTSFWMDIDRYIILILLTNRIHPYRHNYKIKIFRPVIHNAVMEKIMNK